MGKLVGVIHTELIGDVEIGDAAPRFRCEEEQPRYRVAEGISRQHCGTQVDRLPLGVAYLRACNPCASHPLGETRLETMRRHRTWQSKYFGDADGRFLSGGVQILTACGI